MQAVLISIQKEHNDNILSGKKHFEGRKTLPKIVEIDNTVQAYSSYIPSDKEITFYVYEPKNGGGCGKVRYYFKCDFAISFNAKTAVWSEIAKALCVSEEFAKTYFNRDKGYLIRVVCPIEYDKPKELIEFCKPFNPNMDIHEFFKHIGGGFPAPDFKSKYDFCDKITRPPQSWCYVEAE